MWEKKDGGSTAKNKTTILFSFCLQNQPLFFLTLHSNSASQDSEILNPRKTIPYAIPPFKQCKTAQIEYITLPLHINFLIQWVPSLLPIYTHSVLKPDKSLSLVLSPQLCAAALSCLWQDLTASTFSQKTTESTEQEVPSLLLHFGCTLSEAIKAQL